MRRVAETVGTINELLESAGVLTATVFVDGRLSSFDRVPVELRAGAIERLRGRGVYDAGVPGPFCRALMLYRDVPGSWLFGPQQQAQSDVEAAQDVLSRIVSAARHGQERVPTLAKFMVLAAWVGAGRVSFPEEIRDDLAALSRYPFGVTEEERRRTDPLVRSTFLAFSQADDHPSGAKWAIDFWQQNGRLFPCRHADWSAPTGSQRSLANARADFVRWSEEIAEGFRSAYERAALDLYAPDRLEVLSGITARAVQLASAAARTPILWSSEVGSPVARAIVESLIIVKWLIHSESSDASVYLQFKEYGRGQLKLFKLHVEEYVDSQTDPTQELQSYLEALDAAVNQDIMEWAQDIPLGSVFAKQDLRKMASAVGLEHEYRFIFQRASSETHGEWPTLDNSVLERCANVLHGGHRVVREELATAIGPHLVTQTLSIAEQLVGAYSEAVAGEVSATETNGSS